MTLETGGSSGRFTNLASPCQHSNLWDISARVGDPAASESFTRKLVLPDRGSDFTEVQWPDMRNKSLCLQILTGSYATHRPSLTRIEPGWHGQCSNDCIRGNRKEPIPVTSEPKATTQGTDMKKLLTLTICALALTLSATERRGRHGADHRRRVLPGEHRSGLAAQARLTKWGTSIYLARHGAWRHGRCSDQPEQQQDVRPERCRLHRLS